MRLSDSTSRRLAAVVICAALLPGCGDDEEFDQGGGTLTGPGPGVNQIFTEAFTIAGTAELQRPTIVSRDIVVPGSGSVRVEVDWSSVDNDIDLIVTTNSCRSGVAAWNGECDLYGVRDVSSLTKPARVDFSLSAGATVRAYVFNFSTASENAVVQVLHQP